MKRPNLTNHLLDSLKRHGGWQNAGELEREALTIGYKGSTASRILRKLVEEGKIHREERESVFYSYKPQPKFITQVEIKDGVAILRKVQVLA